LHETNGKYENLNSIKSQLHYYHATYYSCSYVIILFMNTSWKQIHARKSHNIKQVRNTKTSQYHITATQHYYQKHFAATATFSLYTLQHQQF